MPDSLSDKRLIEKIIQRDQDALGELYDRYHRLVFSLALHVVGDRQTAEEITLDVFTRVWQKAHTYRTERASVNTWLTRMARNRAIDALRRENVRPEKHSLSWAEVHPEQLKSDNSPEHAAALEMQKQRVRAALAALPAPQREALALAYFKGYTHREIAEVLGQPLGTVKGRIRAGMQKLRQLLIDEQDSNTSRTAPPAYHQIESL